jgi:16S rRNA (guanine966-N2)-methyltransferase
MRIISGYLKGKKINLPKDNLTRPLKDMVKESIFNIIEHSNDINTNLKGALILDLFSGSGSFGLECVSRGAEKVIFNENYKGAIDILEKNIMNLNCHNSCQILKTDCFKLSKNFNKKVDMIFMDPPFKEIKVNNLIASIFEAEILKKDGLIIIHRNKKYEEKLSEKLKILDVRYYGLSKIIFCKQLSF